MVNFLYNPTTVDTSYAIDDDNVSGALVFAQPGDLAAAVVPMNASVSFSLLYDRTFELWGSYNTDGTPSSSTPGTPANMNDAGQGGVNVDIMAFKQLTGQLADQPNGQNGAKKSYFNIQGPMVLVPTWLYLGPPSSGMFYFGYVSAWDATITHWTQFMVPMRCTIAVTFTMIPPPWNEPLTGSGANSFWSLQSLVGPSSPTNGILPTPSGSGGSGGTGTALPATDLLPGGKIPTPTATPVPNKPAPAPPKMPQAPAPTNQTGGSKFGSS
jgi:hypothetical protein